MMATTHRFCGNFMHHQEHLRYLPNDESLRWTAADIIEPVSTIDYNVEMCHGFPTPYGVMYADGSAPRVTATGRFTERPYTEAEMETFTRKLADLLSRRGMDVPTNPARRLVWRIKGWLNR